MYHSINLDDEHQNFANSPDNFSVQCQSILIDTEQSISYDTIRSVDNFVKKSRPKSSMRDAHFWPYFQELRQSRQTPVPAETSVIVGGSYKPSYEDTRTGNTAPSHSPLLKRIEAQLVAEKAKRAPAPKPSRLDRTVRGLQQPIETHLHKWDTPAQWRDLTIRFKVVYLHDAGSRAGVTHAFSLNLRPDVEELAREQPSAASWLHKRIQLELKKAYGRKVDCWLVLEAAQSMKRLHIHGEVILPAQDATLARKALRRAAGEWKQVRQHQCHTSDNPDDGWVSYALKDLAWNSARSRNAPFRGFSGEPYAASRVLRQSAQADYGADRAKVVARLKARNC